jgi:hypothetical protein
MKLRMLWLAALALALAICNADCRFAALDDGVAGGDRVLGDGDDRDGLERPIDLDSVDAFEGGF